MYQTDLPSGELGERLSQRSLRRLQKLSKMLILDSFQISETQADLKMQKNTSSWQPSCFCRLSIGLKGNLMLHPLVVSLKEKDSPW